MMRHLPETLLAKPTISLCWKVEDNATLDLPLEFVFRVDVKEIYHSYVIKPGQHYPLLARGEYANLDDDCLQEIQD